MNRGLANSWRVACAWFLVVAMAASSCSTYQAASPSPTVLSPAEVREYQGQRLSSINEFRENSIRGPQSIDITTYRLKISGLVSSPKQMTYDEVLQHTPYQKVVRLDCVEGWGVTILWEGVLLADLVGDAGVDHKANTVIFHAYDGYTSSEPLKYLMDNKILIAYKMNGVTIPPERGYPLMLVAQDKWGYKWVKWVTEIEVSSDQNYRGYWESRGYSNNGDRGAPYFGFP